MMSSLLEAIHSLKLMEWNGYDTHQTPLHVFCGTEGAHLSF